MMLKEIGMLHRSSWRFALACPLLFAVPVLAELIQHAVELHIGMYQGWTQAQAVESDKLRMATGFVKALSLMLPGYWFLRYLAHGESAVAARTWDARAAKLFAVVLAWGLGWAVVGLWGGAPFRAMGVGDAAIIRMGIATFVGLTVFEIYLAVWKTGAAVGNPALGFRRSIGLVQGRFWWSFGLFVGAFLPLMVLHYALGLGAIGRPAPLAVAMLVVDSVVVGFLATVLIGTNFVIARRAASSAGVALLPGAEAAGGEGSLRPTIAAPSI